MRISQQASTKGSLKWMQTTVNRFPAILNGKLSEQLPLHSEAIEWVSPLVSDDYAEYRDADFLKRLGLHEYTEALQEFWPQRGPQWDALGRYVGTDNSMTYLLVEAKANIPEVLSSCQAKSPTSIQRIHAALEATQNFLQCTSYIPWDSGVYQYANRITHLYFLRKHCHVNAYMIFVYFLNDSTHIPTSYEVWVGANLFQKTIMGLKRHQLQPYVIDVYIDTHDLRTAE